MPSPAVTLSLVPEQALTASTLTHSLTHQRPQSIVWNGHGDAPSELRNAVLAIGNFDGVHLGHKALIAEAKRLAHSLARHPSPELPPELSRDAAGEGERHSRPSIGLVTFEPHPRALFRPDTPVFRLTPAAMRRQLLAGLGCSAVAELTFDRAFADQSADAFVDELLLGRLDAAALVVGHDFAYGKGRAGTALSLQSAFAAVSRPVSIVSPVLDGTGTLVASSRIRTALEEGDITLATGLLGHRWRVRGEIVHGDKRGRLLGYPTANMLLPADNRLRHGIYAVNMCIDGEWHPGVASFGRRPTFDDGAPRLETFVFDFSGDLYGRTVDVEFAGWIRGEQKFDSVEALIAQMDADSERARVLLRS